MTLNYFSLEKYRRLKVFNNTDTERNGDSPILYPLKSLVLLLLYEGYSINKK